METVEYKYCLIEKQWGYQTICPDEEKTTGYYKTKDDKENGCVYGWKRPSLSSEKKEISHLVCKHSIWGWGEKYNKKDDLIWVKVSRKPVFWIPKSPN